MTKPKAREPNMDRRVAAYTVLGLVVIISAGYGIALLAAPNAATNQDASVRRTNTVTLRATLVAGQTAYRSVSVVSFGDLASGSELADRWTRSRTTSEPFSQVDQRTEAELLGFVATLLHHRYVLNDPEAYLAWRRSLGYRFRDRDQLLRFGMDVDYEHYTGLPLPQDATVEEAFIAMWPEASTINNNALAADAISSTFDGVGIGIGQMCPDSDAWPTVATRSIDRSLFEGVNGGTMRNWFVPPGTPYRQRIAQGQCVDVARVGVIVAFTRSDRYPLTFTFTKDPDTNRWWHVGVGMNNFPSNRAAIGEW